MDTYYKIMQHADQLIAEDRYPDALEEYSHLLKLNPKDEKVRERCSFLISRMIEGDYDMQAGSAVEFLRRGLAKFYKKEFENSIEDFNAALAIDPDYDYALKCRAFSLKNLNRMEEAIDNLEQAIKLKPSGQYFDDVAQIAAGMGAMEVATKFYQKAVEADPSDPRLWYNFGVHLNEMNCPFDALEKFDKAIELWPQYEDAIVNRDFLLHHLKGRSKN